MLWVPILKFFNRQNFLLYSFHASPSVNPLYKLGEILHTAVLAIMYSHVEAHFCALLTH